MTTVFITRMTVGDGVQEWIAGTLTIQATFQSDAPEKTAETAMIDGTELTEEAEMSEEAVSIAGAMRRGGSDRLADERTENAAAERTAATS